MDVEVLKKIRQQLFDDMLTWQVAYQMLNLRKREIWHSKEWEIRRNSLIKNFCEQCKSTSGPFVIQHTKQPMSFQDCCNAVYRNLVITAYSKRQIPDNFYVLGNMCPRCKSLVIRQRKFKKPKYVCIKCNLSFEEPLRAKHIELSDEYFEYNKNWHSDFKYQHDADIPRFALIKYIDGFIDYMSMQYVITLCKKCAFLSDVKGKVLCKICGKHYHSPNFKSCFECTKGRKYDPSIDKEY